MRIYEYNAGIGIFEIRQLGHERYELWIEDEKLGEYESPENAAEDVASFDTGYVEWDKFKNDERNFPAGLGDWTKVGEATPR